MTRQNATNFSGTLQFPYANAPTDLFKKEDVQVLALATDQHDHSPGKGLILSPGAIPAGSITSAMIADGTIQAVDIASGIIGLNSSLIQDGAITGNKLAPGAVGTNQIASGAVTTTQIADGTVGTVDLAVQ